MEKLLSMINIQNAIHSLHSTAIIFRVSFCRCGPLPQTFVHQLNSSIATLLWRKTPEFTLKKTQKIIINP